MDIGALFTKNWPYKVAALVLTILLWVSVSADGRRSEQAVPTRLDLQVRDSAWSLREVRPSEIMTTFEGSRGDMFAASLFEQPTIRKVIDQVTDPIMQLPLSASEVIYNRSLGVEPTAVDPETITIHLEERLGKWVPVVGRTDARSEGSIVFVGMELAPDSAWLQGPASFVDAINELRTELLAVGVVSQRVTRQLDIELPPDLTGLEVTPSTVLGSVEVDSVRTRRFQRAITIVGPGAEGLMVEPPTVTVSVTGAAATVDGLEAGDLRVTVDFVAPAGEDASRPVRVDLPPDVTATLDVVPERVRVMAAPSSTPPDPSDP